MLSDGRQLAMVQSRAEITAPVRGFLYRLCIGGALVYLLLLVAVYFAARRLSAPIVELCDQVRDVRAGRGPEELAVTGGAREVEELASAFSSLLRQRDDALRLEKMSSLLALQAQMDPHFLYNMLSVISGIGVELDSDKIVDICDRLGALLRYSTAYDTGGATLGDELENACNYLDLMKLRYEHAFTYSIKLEHNRLDVRVPRLTLQPILENCFAHGFKVVPPPWKIEIRTWLEEDRWCLSVADNGAGIDGEQLSQLDEKIHRFSDDVGASYRQLKIGGLGLVNTIVRLQMFSGGAVEYSFGKNEPGGTVMVIKGGMA